MKKFVFIGFVIFGLAACESPKEKSMDAIRSLEAKDSVFTPQNIRELKSAYLDFANKYPDDDMAPEFMFKAAQRCNVMADHQEALQLFQQIIEKYPKHKISEEALFLQGYIYENSLQDYDKAKQIYADFIKKYPNSELTEDAQYAIQNLGKTPEEILKGFTQKDSSAVHQ
jgi:TolA-binding protein